ncbi:hypothetical protein CONLIGDRAFT_187125 [Coniochaeta ligniaria NRRL 30616]|uniref:Uncharacterized protein n=1 Tax=Coniochaeta ligniaria NRRL 30616 TaxID=1408157 RepID=A0A1J7JW84_9PEZI|nr:hypothetical protein CONLIGDRAFT_187125 [Coniochaeta ligniaria NRRL 30616]
MADAIADSGHLGHEDDINFLEIDFDETAGAVPPTDRNSASMAKDDGAVDDDFDIQIDEFEVVDDAGDNVGDGSVPSDDFTSANLGVPQNNKAESEIGYEDEEPLKAEATTQEFEATGQEQGNNEIVESTDNVDEIDYEDGDFEATQEDNNATKSRSASTASKQQETATTQVLSQQVLDDTVEEAGSAQGHLEADNGSTNESSETGQHVSEKEPFSRTGGDAEDSVANAPASEVSDVMVIYNGVKYELCASVLNDDPETYFFAGNAEMDVPLSQFFGLLRNVIKDEIEPSDDLVIRVPQLKLEFGEETSAEFLEKHTFRNILELYRRFKYNDGEDAEHAQLVVHLVPKPNCQERYAMLLEAADAGRGWTDSGSGEDQSGGTGDDMQHETVEVVEEAYFYDDTNDAGDHDDDHMFDDQEAEDPGYHADNVDDLNQGYGLAGELVGNIEFDQVPDRFDTMGDDHDAAAHQSYAEHDGNSQTSHADAEDFNEEAGSALEDSNALASDHQVHHESAIRSDAGVETAHDSVPLNDFEDGDDGNFAANDSSVDMEGFAAYDEAANNEPLPTESHTQVTDSHDTSATSTVNGDEITYEDENAAHANTESRTHEAGDATAANVDEIDWENDGAEDVAVAEDQTNLSSPSGLSVKRGREADDLISLDDENDAKRRKT